jgi:hypothetical protein
MATVWDQFMAQRGMPEGSPDYTLGSRANLQPTRSPFSPDGRLGNMGMRNMLLAQQRMSTMPGFMPPDYSVPPVAEPRAPFVPQPPMPVRQMDSTLFGEDVGARPMPMRAMDSTLAGYYTPPMPVRQMDSTLFGEDVGARPIPMRAMDSTLAGYDMPPNVPLPPRRPSMPMAPAGAPMQLGSAAPSVRESFMQRLLGGPNYQSNSMPVMPQGATTPQQINFGNPDNPADFVRADRALMGLPEDALRIAGLLG